MKFYNIPIFVPHKGCPFDCVFCNQKHITGRTGEVDEKKIKEIIDSHLQTLPKDDCYVEAAFFGGSFTGIDFDLQKKFLSTAYEYVKSGKIAGIRLSTRPDYIDNKILNQLKEYGVTTIELGVQSLNEDVLKLSNRGHSVSDVINAVKLIKQYDFSLGLQMMTGLPGDSSYASLETADKIIQLTPEFVRIYPTLVIKDTYLEKLYNAGKYQPQTVDEAVLLCKTLLLKFQKAGIRVIRIALQTTDEISPGGSLVAGPFDSQFGELVESEIYYDKFTDYFKKSTLKDAVIFVNTKDISKAVGKKRKNILEIKQKFGINIRIKGKDNIEKYDFSVLAESEG